MRQQADTVDALLEQGASVGAENYRKRTALHYVKRRSPDEYVRQKREAYVRGGGDPVTFTTEMACMAVNELLQGLLDFRRKGSWEGQRCRRLDRGTERLQGEKQDPACPVCSDRTYWGRSDIDPFLDRTA